MKNVIYYGDNLEVLRKYIRDETIDLCYIDPPFNSSPTIIRFTITSVKKIGHRLRRSLIHGCGTNGLTRDFQKFSLTTRDASRHRRLTC